MNEPFRYPEDGMPLLAARLVESRPDRDSDANILSIKRFARNVIFGKKKAAAWITVKEPKQHGHHIYSVEAIKVEALDRIVEVVSGNTPHASSASTQSRITSLTRFVNWLWRCVGRGNIWKGKMHEK